MDNLRWKHLEEVAQEFEEYGRTDERLKYSKHISNLETKLEVALALLTETEQNLERERQYSMRQEQELLRLRGIERETIRLRQKLIGTTLLKLGGKELLFQSCQKGEEKIIPSFFEVQYQNDSEELQEEIAQVKNEALRIACSVGSFNCVELLLGFGADPTARDINTGKNAIHLTTTSPGNSDQVLHLLLTSEWARNHINDVDHTNSTPLATAVHALRVDRVICLLSLGADATCVSMEEWRRLNEFQVKIDNNNEEDTFKEETIENGINLNNNNWTKIMTPTSKSSLPQDSSNFHPPIAFGGGREEVLSDISNFQTSSSTQKRKELSNEEYSDLAHELYSSGKLDQALEIYISLEQKIENKWTKQNRANVLLNTAKICGKLSKHVQSVEYCNKVLVLYPNSYEALIQRAESKEQLFDYNKAALDYELLASLYSDEAKIWLKRAKKMKYLLSLNDDFYHILQISMNSSFSEIRKAFVKQSLRWHPDKNQKSNDEKERASIMMKLINEANTVLSDERKRKEYDLKLISSKIKQQAENSFEEESDEFEEETQSSSVSNDEQYNDEDLGGGEEVEGDMSFSSTSTFVQFSSRQMNNGGTWRMVYSQQNNNNL